MCWNRTIYFYKKGTGRGRGRDPRECYYCGKQGHIRKKCRQLAQEAGAGSGTPTINVSGVTWKNGTEETFIETEVDRRK